MELTVVSKPESIFAALGQGIETAVAEQSARIRAATIAADYAEVEFDTALETATTVQGTLEGITIEEITLGEATFPSIGNPFALGAQSMTVLFMFLTSMTAATQLVLTRQLGVSRRMLVIAHAGALDPAGRAAWALRHRHAAGPLHRASPHACSSTSAGATSPAPRRSSSSSRSWAPARPCSWACSHATRTRPAPFGVVAWA